MSLLGAASTAFLLLCGCENGLQSIDALSCSSNTLHLSRVAQARFQAMVLAEDDTDSHIKQVPPSRLGPAGSRIPEVGPPPPKTEGTTGPVKPNTANCTGANADSPACYTATQQGKGK
jgi:hypothetical protein